ncbi:MAG: Cna B-type domain-containing protein, partial [Clostridia bacterium]|nr:Cna B-type domain-containing protein [Clostridia bacterium]
WEDATGNPIENTSSLPDVEITLFRKAENSETEETVSYITLSDSDGYSETLTLPIRNANDERYTYYIREDCPDGYFTVGYSPDLTAKDGKLTVTNREFPEEGLVAVRKLWKNRIGATLTDTGLPEVEMQLNRHVEKHTPTYFTVTISVQGEADVVKRVVPGSTVSFYVTFYCSKKNQSNGKISLNGTQLATTQMPDSVSYRGNTFWPAVTTNVQSFTINEDTQLSYTYSKTLTTYRHPGCITDGTIHNTDQDNRFVSIEETTQTPPVTSYYDEEYDTFTLNSSNGWQKVYDDLVLSETGDDASSYSYKYYVEEISEVPGFVTSYSSNNTAGVEGGLLTVTNTSTSNITVLPETGGRGSPPVVLTGALTAMIATAIMFFGLSPGRRKKRKRII